MSAARLTKEAVYDIVRAVPPGSVATYGGIARAAGFPHGARTVGWHLHANDTPIAVPCHRVVGADGSLTGYAGGIDKKEKLLALERQT